MQRDVNQPSTSSAEDIVNYIRENYNSDGDLYAQVRTTLRQVCCQGLVFKLNLVPRSGRTAKREEMTG